MAVFFMSKIAAHTRESGLGCTRYISRVLCLSSLVVVEATSRPLEQPAEYDELRALAPEFADRHQR